MKDRIILCRLGGIGDVIHTLPLVKYLRDKYKSASIEYITSSNVAMLLTDCCPFINRVWIFDRAKKRELGIQILSHLGKVDFFFNLHSSFSFFFFNLFYIKAKQYFQYKKDTKVHAAVNFARTFDPLIGAFDLEMKTLLVNNSKGILNRYGLESSKYLCFVPGVGSVRMNRAWPFEKWLTLTKRFLYEEKDFKVLFLGGKDEEKIFEDWLKENTNDLPYFSGRAINLIGKLSLSEVAGVISKSVCLVSCDTGLLHLASALPLKVIGLYGPTLPERSGPFTKNYQVIKAKDCKCISKYRDIKKCKKTIGLTGYCMNNLDVDEVLSNLSFKQPALST